MGAMVVIGLALWGCGDDRGRGVPGDGGADGDLIPRTDGDVGGDTGLGGDAAVLPDGSEPGVNVTCNVHDGPSLVITRPWSGGGVARTLARVDLAFDGAATGVVIEEVVRMDADGAILRTWDGAAFAAPGFDGTVSPREGVPTPVVHFTAADDALASDVERCDAEPLARNGGSFIVRGMTRESGAFETSCTLSNERLFDSDLRFACARGLSGYLFGYPGFGTATEHAITIAESQIAAYGDAPAAIDGIVADGLTVRSFVEDAGFIPVCGPAQTWDATGGTHAIWRGMTSTDIFSGPVAPGTEERAQYFFQVPGAGPTGFCFPPGPADPADECLRPALQLVVTGTSSAGPWEWEGGVFTCYERG
jgi:hypothetical protein